MAPQDIHDERGREYNPGFAVLQCAPIAFSAAAFFAGQGELLFHVDDSQIEIDTVPRQAEQFSATKAGEEMVSSIRALDMIHIWVVGINQPVVNNGLASET